jgi:hypothetical protein
VEQAASILVEVLTEAPRVDGAAMRGRCAANNRAKGR